MNLVPISSEDCPECGVKSGKCYIVVEQIVPLKNWTVKTWKESDMRQEILDSPSSRYREGYAIQKFLCVKGKGIQ